MVNFALSNKKRKARIGLTHEEEVSLRARTHDVPPPRIDDAHRRELLRFLLVKTAAVRKGVKPAELLRVRHCYAQTNAEGFRFCLYRRDIYFTLRLAYVELKAEAESSLVLFYDPAALDATLNARGNRGWLVRLGYPAAGTTADFLAELVRRARGDALPHEVGVFIGYPLKDVVGFMRHLPATPLHRGPWRVYGGVAESLRRMRLYARIEDWAAQALGAADSLEAFYAMTPGFLTAR